MADASTAQKVRRRKPSRHKMDTKLEGSTLMRSGKGSTTTRFVCSPNSFTEAWGSYCSGRLVGVSDASPGSGFLSPNIHSRMRACMHAFTRWSVSPERRDTKKVPIFKFMLKRCFGSSLPYHFHDHSRVKMVSQTSSGSRRAAFLVLASSHGRAGHRSSRHLAMS